MAGMLRLVLVAVLALAAPLAAGSPEISVDPRLLDGSTGRPLARAFIPSDKNVHGEVRLLERGDALCVQTLLYSSALRRGLRQMRRQELGAWPEGDEGYDDSTEYLENLERARARVLERFAEREDRTDSRQKMLIEFVLSDTAALYALYELEITGQPPDVAIRDKRPIVVRSASRYYVRRAMRLMLESAFGEETPLPEALRDSARDRGGQAHTRTQ
jgi:hypothetical protein